MQTIQWPKSAVNSRCRTTSRIEKGFGLLEALVALVLLSSIGFAILAWVQQNLDTMQRMKGLYAEQAVRRQIVDLAKTINPMKDPTGEAVIDGKRFVWESVVAGDRISQSGYPQGIGLYDVALYRVTFSVFRPQESTPWLTESVDLVGRTQVRELGNPFKN